jgi:DNA-binding transcriptional LysR family regulator
MDLESLRIFLAVADHGGLLAAARALEQPKQTVSRRLVALEAEIGVELFARERRPIELTPAGIVFAARCRQVIEGAEAAVREARAQVLEPQGVLRIAAPQLFARKLLAGVLTALAVRYPALRIRLVTTDDLDPAVPWHQDAVFWIGEPPDVRWRVRRIGEASNELCAAPGLLARIDPPVDPRDLATLPTLDYHRQPRRRAWVLRRDDTTVEVALEPRLETNEPEVVLDAALAGLGIANLPGILVRDHLEQGRLRQVLPGWRAQVGPVLLLYPSHVHPPARLEALLSAVEALALHLPGPVEPR